MVLKRYGTIIAIPVLLAACTDQLGKSTVPIETPEVVTVGAPKVTLRSDSMIIGLQVNDGSPRDWTITPQLSPDTLVVECTADEKTHVTFTTDVETQTFSLSDKDALLFDILVGELTALTEIRCTPPKQRFKGSYSPSRKNANDFSTDLAPLLNTYFDDSRPGIILLVADGDKPVFKTAVGRASMVENTPRLVDEAFDIASISKEFTAISILQLAELGKLALEDPLNLYLDNIPNGDTITLHHLLTHTHGLTQITNGDGYDMTKPLNVDAALDTLRKKPIRFAPGDQYEYGNTPYFLLSLIAEKVSGLDRKLYIRKNIFDRAGMSESSFITDVSVDDRVTGYNETNEEITLRTFEFPDSHVTGTGDIISTLDDMLKWQRSLANGTLISPEIFSKAVAPKYLNDGTEISRGYGFFRGTLDDEVIIYNTGDLYTRTRHYYIPSRDLSVILNLNGSVKNDGALPSIVLLQIIGRVLNREELDMFDERIVLGEL